MSKLSKQSIRRIIREVLTPQVAQQKYGKVLFGDARGLGEPDTPEEDELEAALVRWSGAAPGSPELQAALEARHIQELRDLYKSGLYNDVLVPRTPIAYRFIKLTSLKAAMMAAGKGSPVEFNGERIGFAYVLRGKKFPILPGMPAASWARNFDQLDFLFEFDPEKTAGLFAVAPTGGPNKGSLLFNPGDMGGIGNFDAEGEFLQVDTLSKVDMHILVPKTGYEEEMAMYFGIYGSNL